jgi:hypothetical protein
MAAALETSSEYLAPTVRYPIQLLEFLSPFNLYNIQLKGHLVVFPLGYISLIAIV